MILIIFGLYSFKIWIPNTNSFYTDDTVYPHMEVTGDCGPFGTHGMAICPPCSIMFLQGCINSEFCSCWIWFFIQRLFNIWMSLHVENRDFSSSPSYTGVFEPSFSPSALGMRSISNTFPMFLNTFRQIKFSHWAQNWAENPVDDYPFSQNNSY